jgi:hypothetical protein
MALLSGGKDSVYMLSLLEEIPNFRILAVTIDHWFNSRQAETNTQQILKEISVDHINFRPSWKLFKKLYQQSVKNTGELCLACEGFLTSEIYYLSSTMKIPSMAWGLTSEQFRTPPNWLLQIDLSYWEKMKKRFFSPLKEICKDNPSIYKKFSQNYIPQFDNINSKLPELIFPFVALGYDPDRIEKAINRLGWVKPNDVGGISSNCYGNFLHMGIKNYQYSNAELEDYFSDLVRKNVVSRKTALGAIQEKMNCDVAKKILNDLNLDTDLKSLAINTKNKSKRINP